MKTIKELKDYLSSVSYQTAFGCLVGSLVLTGVFVGTKIYKKVSKNSREK